MHQKRAIIKWGDLLAGSRALNILFCHVRWTEHRLSKCSQFGNFQCRCPWLQSVIHESVLLNWTPLQRNQRGGKTKGQDWKRGLIIQGSGVVGGWLFEGGDCFEWYFHQGGWEQYNWGMAVIRRNMASKFLSLGNYCPVTFWSNIGKR